jgi:hypothetical protein
LPDSAVGVAIRRVQRRWLVRAMAWAVTVAGAVFAAAIVLSSTVVAIMAAAIALVVMWLRSPALSSVDAARVIERRFDALDNLVVTAAELDARPREIRGEIRDEIARQAGERIRAVDPGQAVPLGSAIAAGLAVLVGCALLVRADGDAIRRQIEKVEVIRTARGGVADLVVRVTPPAYTRRKHEVLENPMQVTVIAGSRVQIEFGGATLRDMVATESAALDLRVSGESRFLSLVVIPDTPPQLRVVTPGRDTAMAEPKGQVPIAIEGRDDLGLSSLVLRYTKASGGGENVAFSEGEVPLRIDRASEQQWRADARLSLEALDLADGDIVVYRAIARDTNPSGTPVQSDQYLIEIGRNAEIADAGFALPSEEKKYAISQQMVIYKTEQLMSGAARLSPEARLEQSRNIGMEQRMVRAEVVFLGGGEVQDEVEEAAHSHELAEGRLENSGRAEMLLAINAMSRAETHLNDGRLKEALVFERQALTHLERALDRRRYFLRTLPDRSRIDTGRRLTGERKEARSWTRDEAPAPAVNFDGLRRVIADLSAAAAQPAAANASLAARVAAIDPSSTDLQGAAVAIASASNDAARRTAVQSAIKAVTAYALTKFPPSSPVDIGGERLSGLLADELARRPRQ